MKYLLDRVGDSYFKVEDEAWKEIDKKCNCSNPGKELQCITCPSYLEVRKKVFSKLHKENFDDCPPPLFYAEEQEMWVNLNDIIDNPSIKNEALNLYKEYQDIDYVAEELKIDKDIISLWIMNNTLQEKGEVFYYPQEFVEYCVSVFKKYETKYGTAKHQWSRLIGLCNLSLINWENKITNGGKTKKSRKEFEEKFLERWNELDYKYYEKIEMLAEEFNVTTETIKAYVSRLKLGNFYLSEEKKVQCVELYKKYESSFVGKRESVIEFIRKELGISYSSAYRCVQKFKKEKDR